MFQTIKLKILIEFQIYNNIAFILPSAFNWWDHNQCSRNIQASGDYDLFHKELMMDRRLFF
jgi:hypothetical protein